MIQNKFHSDLMKIRFSSHADYQLKQRGLARKEIVGVIHDPDKLIKQKDRRFRAIKKTEKSGKIYLLVVIFEKNDSNKLVVTAFITSKIKKYL